MTWSLTINLVSDFLLGGVEFEHEEKLMLCVNESFYMKYELEFDTFAFEEQCDDSLHAFILASLSSLPSPSHEARPSVPSSSSLELKPLPNTIKFAFLGSNEVFPVIITNYYPSLKLVKGKPRGYWGDLRRH